ncbi:MAG: DUF2341 domain-containing protein [Chitinispirillaceae bacterium]|nr:DUF2341 domain-containing protein [Chitinispirillaceae bacterium]
MTALCAAALFTGCGDLSLAEGGFGSETTNGIVMGIAMLPDGSASSGARVTVRTADFVREDFPRSVNNHTRGDVITDSSGAFMIDSLDTGSYIVEINNGVSHAAMSECRIASETPKVNLAHRILLPYVTIVGWVDPQLIPGEQYVQVVGLDRLVPVDSAGSFIVNDLPSGTLQIRIAAKDTVVHQVFDKVSGLPGDTVTIAPPGWRHSRKVYLNTTATGAEVYADVVKFPVLVRLDTGNFNFAEARPDGGDLKFTRSNSMPLPFEIEQWDGDRGIAAVWVLVDTVYGNDSSHYFIMHWGNENAVSASSGASVFDTLNGHIGVWHLGETTDDATWHDNDATTGSALPADGMIGSGRQFNGTDSLRIDGLLNEPQTVTLSAWARLDSAGGSGAEIVTIGNACLLRMEDIRTEHGAMGAFHMAGDTVFYNVYSGKYLKKTGWHHFAFVIDSSASSQALYIDGILSSLHNSKTPINYTETGKNTCIGKHGNGKNNYYFRGVIDEVRISSAVLSADRVKLEFMNQNENNVLVVQR